MKGLQWSVFFFVSVVLAAASGAEKQEGGHGAGRGRDLVHHPLNPPFWSVRGDQEAWKQWGHRARPGDYDRAFRERYGLHEARYHNGGLPMGFTRSRGMLGLGTGLGSDCLLCHGGKVRPDHRGLGIARSICNLSTRSWPPPMALIRSCR